MSGDELPGPEEMEAVDGMHVRAPVAVWLSRPVRDDGRREPCGFADRPTGNRQSLRPPARPAIEQTAPCTMKKPRQCTASSTCRLATQLAREDGTAVLVRAGFSASWYAWAASVSGTDTKLCRLLVGISAKTYTALVFPMPRPAAT